MIYVGQCATLNVVVIVSNRSRIDVVVGVDTGTVDRAGTGAGVVGSTSVSGCNSAHTVTGAVGVY